MKKDKKEVAKPKKSLKLDVENLRELTAAESDEIIGGTDPASCPWSCKRNTNAA